MEQIRPTLYMMVGLPGSGKSSFSDNNIHGITGIKFSSDKLREELFGDAEYDRNNNTLLFSELHRRIKTQLLCGKNAIYDATNINKKKRVAFLRELKSIPCKKVCIIMATPYQECLKRNRLRLEKGEAGVPGAVIKRMYMNWEPPHKSEGWDEIHILYPFENGELSESIIQRDMIEDMKNIWMPYDQCNSHHRLTLGAHMMYARDLICKKVTGDSVADQNLRIAAFLHDIGKPFTQTYIKPDGEEDTDAHYYNHHNVGSYEAMFYVINEMRQNPSADEKRDRDDNILDICNLIFYHMHPYMSWKQSEAAKEKDRRFLGNEMFNRIMLLHEADAAAH